MRRPKKRATTPLRSGGKRSAGAAKSGVPWVAAMLLRTNGGHGAHARMTGPWIAARLPSLCLLMWPPMAAVAGEDETDTTDSNGGRSGWRCAQLGTFPSAASSPGFMRMRLVCAPVVVGHRRGYNYAVKKSTC